MKKKRPKNQQLEALASQVINSLHQEGFIIQRYNSMSTDSIYLKFDYGVCNSLRISNHGGKPEYKYRYNLIIGGETNIIEDKFIRYYYNENDIVQLIQQIIFDKYCKINKYGTKTYNVFMDKNKDNNSGKKGFWSNAVLLEDRR